MAGRALPATNVGGRIDPDLPESMTQWQIVGYREAAARWAVWEAERDGRAPENVGDGGRAFTFSRRVSGLVADTGDDLPRLDVLGPGSDATRWVRNVEALGGPGELIDEAALRRGVRRLPRTLRKIDAPGTCGVPIGKGVLTGKRCPRVAGQGTAHLGAGQCVAHGGNRGHGRTIGAWLMAHAFGAELDISPWEALLRAVRIAAGKSAYCEWVLSQASNDLELEGRFGRTYTSYDEEGNGVGSPILLHPDTGEPLGAGQLRDLSWWVAKSELWHDRMARTAKMAIDAGVAKWQIERMEAEATAIATVLNAVIEGMSDVLTEEQALTMRALMRNQLLALDAQHAQRASITASGDADAPDVDGTYRTD